MVETNVHFPADTSQLFDAIRKTIEVIATLSELQGSTEWRQFAHNIRGIKRALRVVQKLKNSTSQKPEKKALKDSKLETNTKPPTTSGTKSAFIPSSP